MANRGTRRSWSTYWLAVGLFLTGAVLPKIPVTVAAVVSRILLGGKVPPDNRIIFTVRRETGNKKFDRKTLAWYKTRARQGKLRGQDGQPHVIDQKVARYHSIGRFGAEGTRI